MQRLLPPALVDTIPDELNECAERDGYVDILTVARRLARTFELSDELTSTLMTVLLQRATSAGLPVKFEQPEGDGPTDASDGEITRSIGD